MKQVLVRISILVVAVVVVVVLDHQVVDGRVIPSRDRRKSGKSSRKSSSDLPTGVDCFLVIVLSAHLHSRCALHVIIEVLE